MRLSWVRLWEGLVRGSYSRIPGRGNAALADFFKTYLLKAGVQLFRVRIERTAGFGKT
jgi:hypothetical protein